MLLSARTSFSRATRPLAHAARARPAAAALARLHTRTVKEWIDDMTSKPAEGMVDLLDLRRATQQVRTLPTREQFQAAGSELTNGDPLPKGHHLIYFEPDNWFTELAEDGTATEYNAPEPYTRRMWAGGEMQWRPESPLRLGDTIVQDVRIKSAVVKNDMMFVQQERKFFQNTKAQAKDKWSLREERTHVFLQDKNVESKHQKKPKQSEPPTTTDKPNPAFTYTPTSPLLFRYSALTWNAHKIHYDLEWTQDVEGHQDLVVHGPMTATLLVDLASREADERALVLTDFDYRATSPMYVNRETKMYTAWDGPAGSKLKLWAEQDGKVGMKATAKFQQA